MALATHKAVKAAGAPAAEVGALRRFASSPGRSVALALLVALVFLRWLDPTPVESLRLRLFDAFQEWAPREYAPLPVKIVEIDEASLAKYGQWPWPRTLVARLVEGIAAAQPRVLGVDIVFVEPDRTSPGRLAEFLPDLPPEVLAALGRLPPNEARLAEAFGRVPTVLGMGAAESVEGGGRAGAFTLVRETGGDPRPHLVRYPALLRSLDEIGTNERGRGMLTAQPDEDGLTRRVPLVVLAGGRLVPTLSVEMLRVALNQSAVVIEATPSGAVGARVDRQFLPTDRDGRTWVHFTPPLDNRYVSAVDILDGKLDPAQLRGAFVLLGVTGLGLVDLRTTPLGPMQGIEIHAQLIESMLTQSFLTRPRLATPIELGLVAVAGLAAIFLFPHRRPALAALPAVLLALAMLGGSWAMFRHGATLVDGGFPSLSGFAVFAVMLTSSLVAAEQVRRRMAAELDRQRQAAARLEGELAAARSIQMGLLPQTFPAFPDRQDLDVFALIEPARMVGGDLYDFVLVDEGRLFFMIGDVSGKGIPAALFMAMTKELFRSNALRHGPAVDRIVADANAHIARAGGDLARDGADAMFVTAFAGLLDLKTGAIEFCNAGHDSPIVIAQGAGPRAIGGLGGPPLGSVDDFPYEREQAQLAPGETMVLFTDGVTEAMNAKGELYSSSRVNRTLAQVDAGDPPSAVVARLNDSVVGFADGFEQADDIAVLAIRWNGPAGPEAGASVS